MCIKDGKGGIVIFYIAVNESNMHVLVNIWSFGEIESNLMTEEGKWGANYIIDDISTGYGVNYEESGIYYEIDKKENDGGYSYKCSQFNLLYR